VSNTFISISDVPEFGGLPPSTAVNTSCICGLFSRSRAFCSTNSGDILSSLVCGFYRGIVRLDRILANTIQMFLFLQTRTPLYPPLSSRVSL
uniref:Uncharacterized protein n=1 Tax=Dicentrarchus labrax TaxID=13489 RepID=A0A8C4DQX1_DICLA